MAGNGWCRWPCDGGGGPYLISHNIPMIEWYKTEGVGEVAFICGNVRCKTFPANEDTGMTVSVPVPADVDLTMTHEIQSKLCWHWFGTEAEQQDDDVRWDLDGRLANCEEPLCSCGSMLNAFRDISANTLHCLCATYFSGCVDLTTPGSLSLALNRLGTSDSYGHEVYVIDTYLQMRVVPT